MPEDLCLYALGSSKQFLFGGKQFTKLLLENYQLTFAEQSQTLLAAFNDNFSPLTYAKHTKLLSKFMKALIP